jgi:arginyl-tRNA synthetase
LKAGVAALGIERDRLEIRLGQLVNIVGRRMSKRSGNFIKLDSIIDEMGADATRLLSLLNSIDQATTLDIDLMKRRSMENPVFYVQYAHARIASIDRRRAERGIERVPISEANLALLVDDRELELIRCLVDLPHVVGEAAKERAPHKVTNWVRLLAGEFHGFYHDCRVLSDEVPPELTQARLWLVEGVQIGLAIALDLLGVRAPEAM